MWIVAHLRLRVAYIVILLMTGFDRRPLRLLHTSDVHLGAFSSGPRGREDARCKSMEQGFSAVVNLAIKENVDVLLIVGDFFDNGRVTDDLLDFAASEIERFPGETVILPGNHDPIGKYGPYDRFNLGSIASRVHIFKDHEGSVFCFEKYNLEVWGRAVDDGCTISPLKAVPSLGRKNWCIAAAHGHFVLDDEEKERSLRINASELELVGQKFDYIALGHWEVQQAVSSNGVEAIYSGSPFPFSDDVLASVILVDFEEGHLPRWNSHTLPNYL